jgi:hypothetical protein
MTLFSTALRRPSGVLTAAVAAVLAFAGACGDFTSVPASLAVVADSGTVYALNGAPPGAPTALHVYTGSRLAADASFFFDVAFDIDAAGNVLILPQRVVASGLASSHTVGLQSVPTDYSSLDKAPKNGYRADTTLITRVGQTVAIQSYDLNVCSISITGQILYAKLVVREVNVDKRTISFEYTIDPNCGFLSFAPGIPKE